MAYYEPQAWQLPGGGASWEQQPSSRNESSSAIQRDNPGGAFHTQIEEIDRAMDNLAKSGKLGLVQGPSRRESMPMMGGPGHFNDYASRMGGMGMRHHSIDYDQMRPQSGSGLQNYYASQRHQPRQNEAEQAVQAKRRMAAQRERELRNYHQEQQYNRSASTKGNSDRANSPNTINEEDRRELIARQHRALYGNDSKPYFDGGVDDSHGPRPSHPTSGSIGAQGGRGPSPNAFSPFAMGQGQTQSALGEAVNAPEQSLQSKGPSPKPQQQRSRADSTSSPASNTQGQNFGIFENTQQQSSRTSTSSPGGSPPRQAKTSGPNVAPIGTRPNPAQASNPALTKRSGTPSASPLSYSFTGQESLNATAGGGNERSTSAGPNPSSGGKDSNVAAWGAPSSGAWGSSSSTSNKPVGVQASVWG